MANVVTVAGKRGTTYRVNYLTTAKRQSARSFKSARMAEQYRRWRELEPDAPDAAFDLRYGAGVAAPKPAPRRATAPTIGEFGRAVLAADDASRHRAAADASVFAVQLAPLHNRPLDAPSQLEIRAWMRQLRASYRPAGRRDRDAVIIVETGDDIPDGYVRAYSDRTVSDALALLRRIYRAAITAKHVKPDENPAVGFGGPRRARRALTESDVYTVAELDAVLKCIPDYWRPFFTVLADTGARLSEAVGLHRDHYVAGADFPLTLGARVAEEVDGKIDLRGYGKTESSTGRKTWLMPDTVAALDAYLATGAGDGVVMFATERTGEIPNRANLRRIWDLAVERSGVGRNITMRNLRHTAATHMLAAGLGVVEVAARLGHSDPSITLSTYARWIPQAHTGVAKMTAWRDAHK